MYASYREKGDSQKAYICVGGGEGEFEIQK